MSIHTIRMPDIGEGIAEVEIVEWKVKVGDSVKEDQTLCDVMTDKAAVEVPSPATGRVTELGGEVGQVMAVGSVLIRIDDDSGAGDAAVGPAAPAAAPPPSPDVPTPPPPAATKPATPSRVPSPPPAAAPKVSSAPSSQALAAPAVRQRARELGIDLSTLKGSGPEGHIVHADLDAARSTGTRTSTTTATARTIARMASASGESSPRFNLYWRFSSSRNATISVTSTSST